MTTKQHETVFEADNYTAYARGTAHIHRDEDINQCNVDCDIEEIEVVDDELGERSYYPDVSSFIEDFSQEDFDMIYTQFWEEVV